MIPFDTFVLRPVAAQSVGAEAVGALSMLVRDLAARGLEKDNVLAVTVFVDPGGDFAGSKAVVLSIVREFFGRRAPPITVVAQAPEGRRHLVLEAAVVPDWDAEVERCRCGPSSYTRIRRGATRQIYCGGIASDPRTGDTEEQASEAFALMRAVLEQEDLDFGAVVRQWSYIEGLLDVRPDCPRGHQRYQAFNDVRSVFYASSEFPAGYPAATGIGQAAGGVALEFLALAAPPDVRIAPVSNPRQTDAHRYSGRMLVGEALDRLGSKAAPQFERAKRVVDADAESIFVSGTASIVGERSVGVGDVELQTRTTIENIEALVGGRGLSRLRAYVRRPGDFGTVRQLCERAFGAIPALYVQADVCRDDLLVELEGALRVEARLPAARLEQL